MYKRQIGDRLRILEGTYKPRTESEPLLTCLNKHENKYLKGSPSDRDVFDLLLYGNFATEFIVGSLSGATSYYISRSQIADVIQAFQGGQRVIVVHSYLGNGRTLLLEGIKTRAHQVGYTVYSLVKRTSRLTIDCLLYTSPSPRD